MSKNKSQPGHQVKKNRAAVGVVYSTNPDFQFAELPVAALALYLGDSTRSAQQQCRHRYCYLII